MQKFIDHIKRYVVLNETETQFLISKVNVLTVKKKEFLLQEGNVCKANYFVEEGLLRMFFINEKGVEQITQFALENWWLSDYMSFTKQLNAQFCIQAVEQSEVIAIPYYIQDELFEKLPQLEKYFRMVMQRAYAASQMRFKYFYDYSKEENYRQFVSLFPEFVQRIPQYMLASYLGLTPEYLSELRKKN
ncbi:Crp/Fnr family transcriptional regulator [Pedobacter insulae]|uniref:cAMP-binding domain of CRP or a regulatory subunit of cAMP-dependent protein kinases n=1 Tax=Pedobacter insulae TaxID=414048 RepID=A0A1I2YT93_9SPHI|nr:Crp/Fnr family transcriptional regulator [Pedobacter insulae]SFH28479.1 cAMP-binding domain of CRP or a regulatory subunit of cAMP-dependent protein kinases [Pedobacter insulae]